MLLLFYELALNGKHIYRPLFYESIGCVNFLKLFMGKQAPSAFLKKGVKGVHFSVHSKFIGCSRSATLLKMNQDLFWVQVQHRNIYRNTF